MCADSATQRKARIAILGTRGIPAKYGGFETFAEQIAVRLAQRGFEVTVYAESNSANAQAYIWQGVNVQPMLVPRWGAASVIGYDVRCLWHARQRFDLVYMLGYGAAFACGLPRLYGVPVWINVDGLEWARSKWGWLTRRYLRIMEWVASHTASRVIADAEVIAQRFRSLYPRGAICSYLAYGAPLVKDVPSHAALASLGLRPDTYFLVVARLEPENHVLDILRGYDLYRKGGGLLSLVIVGDHTTGTSYACDLQARAIQGVSFIGAIYDASTLQSLRCGALAYLHGHSVGGTNPSLLESLGCGSVVIAHDNSFNREVLGDETDYFRQASEVMAALERVERMSGDEIATRRQAARDIIAERYTWEQISSQYERLLLSEFREI